MNRLPALLLLVACLASPTSQAAQSYDSCSGFVDSLPAVIATQGTWCLRADLSTTISTGAAIEILVNNVTLDCNDFKIGGLGAGPGTLAVGVLASQRVNTTIRNCNIRGFFRGTNLPAPSSGHLIENNRFESNTWLGVGISSSNGIIRNNLVTNTGGSTQITGAAFGIIANGNGMSVLDNSVAGVESLETGEVYGIYAAGNVTIARNRVGNLRKGSGGDLFGIYSVAEQAAIHDNVVNVSPLVDSTVGVRCSDSQSVARGNILLGVVTLVQSCTSSANVGN